MNCLQKTFSLTENQFSGKTYFYTIASSSPAKRRIFTAVSDDSFPLSSSKVEKVERLLVSSESIDCEELRQLSWSGLSPRVRPKAWRILGGNSIV